MRATTAQDHRPKRSPKTRRPKNSTKNCPRCGTKVQKHSDNVHSSIDLGENFHCPGCHRIVEFSSHPSKREMMLRRLDAYTKAELAWFLIDKNPSLDALDVDWIVRDSREEIYQEAVVWCFRMMQAKKTTKKSRKWQAQRIETYWRKIGSIDNALQDARSLLNHAEETGDGFSLEHARRTLAKIADLLPAKE